MIIITMRNAGLVATMLLSACLSTSEYKQRQRAEILELPAHLSVEGEYIGIVEPIIYPKSLKIRPYKAPNVKWNKFLEMGDMTFLRDLGGSLNLGSQNGLFKEVLQVNTTSNFLWFNFNGRSRYPKTKDNTTKQNFKLVARKTRQGTPLGYDEIDEASNSISKVAQGSALEVLSYTTSFLHDAEVKSGELETFPLIDDKGEEYGSRIFKVSGLTYRKERPSILFELVGNTVVKDKSGRNYKVKTKGYILIDEYTGTVVLMDIVSQLDNEKNAAYFSREVLEIDLDKDTPILSDQLVMFNQKAAQL